MISSLVTLALLYMAALVIPGPNLLLLTHTAASSSRRAALGVALGIATGTFLWVVVAVFGVQQIFAAVPPLQLALKAVGGAYLLYLAFGMFRSFWVLRSLALSAVDESAGTSPQSASDERHLAHYRRGLLTNLTNPKSLAFWTSVAVVSIDPSATLTTRIACVVMVGLIGLVWHIALAYVFSTVRAQRAYVRAKPLLLILTGSVMVLFGGRLLLGLRG